MTTVERIINLFDNSGLEYKQIAQNLGIKPQKISEWKNGTTRSYEKYLDIIAKEFNVSIDYLVNGTIYPINAEPADFSNSEVFPILGKVAAGLGSYADPDNIVGYKLAEPDEVTEGYDHAWLQVDGDSMEPELHEGDYVFVRIQDYVETGDLAVVLVDDELGVVKKIEYQENHHITLISFNPDYEPKTFIKEDMNHIRIFGKVVGMRRKFW